MKKQILPLLAFTPLIANAQFALHNGDRVVFYGDSITDQRLYTLYTEQFVRTRFPKLDVSFVHSGWGGDRVSGGGGGDIDTRLTRDVLEYKPTVVTVMLGMNDAGYRAYDEGLFNQFSKGYEHIVDRLKREDPGVRFTLIEPSPYDDVTRAANFEGGYNGTLLRYSDYVKGLGERSQATVADLNTPVVSMLQNANSKDAANAQKIIPDRVHPGEAGHLVMAEALLKAWNAPSVVSNVEVTDGRVTKTDNTRVWNFNKSGAQVSWDEQDRSLPFALNLQNPLVRLVVDSSDFVQSLDQETLKVSGLSGRYNLKVDGTMVGSFSADELGAGINLAVLATPMSAQAARVQELVRERAEAHQQRWRSFQTGRPFGSETSAAREKASVMRALDDYDRALDREARKAAEPKPHRFVLEPAG